MQIRIEALDPQIGQTTKGTPKRGVKHDGQWLALTHENRQLLAGLTPGLEIEISEPKQYRNTWFASLKKVIEKPPPAEEASKPAPPQPGKANGGGIAWIDYLDAIRAAHAVALELEPDVEGGIPDRSQARAALVNTLAIALTNGRIELPKDEEPETPF